MKSNWFGRRVKRAAGQDELELAVEVMEPVLDWGPTQGDPHRAHHLCHLFPQEKELSSASSE